MNITQTKNTKYYIKIRQIDSYQNWLVCTRQRAAGDTNVRYHCGVNGNKKFVVRAAVIKNELCDDEEILFFYLNFQKKTIKISSHLRKISLF